METIASAFARFRAALERERSAFFLSRWLFLRLLGVIYLIAFLSLWTQIDGLVGHDGILPAVDYLKAVREQAGPERYWQAPTFCWLSASDGFLHFQCAAGAVLSLLLIAGVAPVVDLILLWASYLSLSTVCGEFLGFQWDILLLETGFLAIFLAPRHWLPRFSRETVPSVTVLWLCRWLLFRLMFMSGAVKLLSGDATWRNLTALTIHYETQPLPTWIGWYAHQLPVWFQKTSVAIMFVIELAVPFLIFCGRRARQIACGAFTLLMLLISITGNYCFFNLLTVALCVLLPDDDFLLRLAPAAVAAFVRARLMSPAEPELGRSSFLAPRRRSGERTEEETPNIKHQTPSIDSPRGRSGERTQQETSPSDGGKRVSSVTVAPVRERLGLWATIRAVGVGALAVVIALVSGIETTARLSRAQALPAPLLGLLRLVSPLRTINSYGLFSIMTTTRPEIVVEGSNDRSTWLPYEFKWKPGDPKRGPAFVAPHQPRLDWQMWFAALGDYRANRWFLSFMVRLLQGSPEVLGLLEKNPFPAGPPRYLRAVLYQYHFTDFALRRADGDWWRRERNGLYCPEIALRQNGPEPARASQP